MSLLASTAFSTRVSRYAFRLSKVSDVSWGKKANCGMVLLVLQYGLGERESPSPLHHTKSLRCALFHFDELVGASPTGTVACLLRYVEGSYIAKVHV